MLSVVFYLAHVLLNRIIVLWQFLRGEDNF